MTKQKEDGRKKVNCELCGKELTFGGLRSYHFTMVHPHLTLRERSAIIRRAYESIQ